ncbi:MULTISPECIES: hypothetical protein [Bacillus cereus group]|uniref:hypothetical protein n=1 Tax=Bacillus cereus group TaxID=86661 RepID=UPI0022E0AC2A|nr:MULTISPECIES: hypothetical protein [unclassified Bacillus cereus group]MDA2665068.1 hypothetical protein [Bacillus cereus group sp. Bc032]MDA2676014.1 hypothetical protein [Bacillus cereus group sp. Bc031]MDA2681484.1 hypothetical protein [Bacillus cereus group sp. Bc029]MDA2686940.1 hypothetical protein [Bacillus cereus group sp. Bc030]MDA2742937.1 hypothetical protein [Bacillus cereus group sp. Bc011]
MTDCSSHRSWISLKAEAARSEQEGVGTPDYEALFASNEGVKQPTVLAAGAGYHLKAEAARSEQEGVGTPDYEALFSMEWSLLLVHEIYINDFLIISAIPFNISAIFQLYRRFHPIYQRFSQYIDLPTNHDNISAPLPYFHQYITISFMLRYRKHPLVN